MRSIIQGSTDSPVNMNCILTFFAISVHFGMRHSSYKIRDRNQLILMLFRERPVSFRVAFIAVRRLTSQVRSDFFNVKLLKQAVELSYFTIQKIGKTRRPIGGSKEITPAINAGTGSTRSTLGGPRVSTASGLPIL